MNKLSWFFYKILRKKMILCGPSGAQSVYENILRLLIDGLKVPGGYALFNWPRSHEDWILVGRSTRKLRK